MSGRNVCPGGSFDAEYRGPAPDNMAWSLYFGIPSAESGATMRNQSDSRARCASAESQSGRSRGGEEGERSMFSVWSQGARRRRLEKKWTSRPPTP